MYFIKLFVPKKNLLLDRIVNEKALRNDVPKTKLSCNDSQTCPENFNKWNDSHAKDKTQKTSNIRQVCDPGQAGLRSHLQQCRLFEVNLNHCNINIIGRIFPILFVLKIWIYDSSK